MQISPEISHPHQRRVTFGATSCSDRARRHFGRRCNPRMNLASALAFAALLVATSESCERHGAQCPEYTLLQTHQDYEEREYPSLVWVSVSGNGKSKSDVSRKLIKKLYSYLGGANDKEMTLDMMVPVRTKKVVHEGFNTYTMSIPLRPEQSRDPPQPEDASITVVREPKTTYLVRSFDGYARQDSIWDDHAAALKASLPTDGAADTSFYYICVYDSPWRETDRLNEVWLVKA